MRTPDEKKVKDEKGVKAEKKEEDTDDDDSNADSDNDQEPKPEDAEVRDVRYKLENLDFLHTLSLLLKLCLFGPS